LAHTRWQADPQQRNPHSLQTVLSVAEGLAEQVAAALNAGHLPLVLGGDCSIEIGMDSGMLRQQDDLALLYFDGGCDLRTPADEPSGILDSMGVAHMIALPGTAAALREIGPRVPLMPQDKIVFFAYTPDLSVEEREEVLDQYAMPRYPVEQVQAAPEAVAMEVRARLESMAQQFIIHFDVDVIDFMDSPLADVAQHNAGLTLNDALACLKVFVASPRFGGLVITECNPDHADEEGLVLRGFVQGLAGALSPGNG
jgi:arginase